jgi:hypothetical protein
VGGAGLGDRLTDHEARWSVLPRTGPVWLNADSTTSGPYSRLCRLDSLRHDLSEHHWALGVPRPAHLMRALAPARQPRG